MKASTFLYPPRIRRIVSSVAVMVLFFNFISYLWTWARVIYGLLRAPLELSPVPALWFVPLYGEQILPALFSAHLSLFIALWLARTVAFLAPSVTLGQQGFIMRSILEWRTIPYKTIQSVRSTELQSSKRYVLWVSAKKGLPLQGALGSLLFGRRFWRGFLLTSDLNGFDEVVGRIVGELKRNFGDNAELTDHFKEETPTLMQSMTFAPSPTIHQLVTAAPLPFDRRTATWQMIAVACSLAAPMILAALIDLRFLWGIIIIPLLVMLEWPLASVYLMAISESFNRELTFDEALRLYPATQLPRWLVAFGLMLLIAMAAPAWLILIACLPAIGLGCYTVVKLVEGRFEAKFPNSLISILITALYQLIVYVIFVLMLPR